MLRQARPRHLVAAGFVIEGARQSRARRNTDSSAPGPRLGHPTRRNPRKFAVNPARVLSVSRSARARTHDAATAPDHHPGRAAAWLHATWTTKTRSPPAQPRRTPAGTSLADDAFRWATAEEGRYSGGADETDDARLHTHATVDNTVQEVDVVLVGDADDLAAALKALDTALEEGEAAAADDPAAVLRAAFNDRAAAATASAASLGEQEEEGVGSDATGYTGDVDQDRDADQDMTVGHGMAT